MANTNKTVEPAPDEISLGPPVESFSRLNNPSRRFYIIFSVVFLATALFAIYQTELCLVAMGKVLMGTNAIREQITKSKDLKSEVATKCDQCSISTTIVAHSMFDERQKNLISRATREVLDDPEVVRNFPPLDGLPLDQTRAVILPLWKLNNRDDWKQMGLTEAGVICGQDDSDDPMGLTIRERPVDEGCFKKLKPVNPGYPKTANGTPQMTKDGTPRIAINSYLINEETFKELKFTLLHEFVHAHEVPGFKPIWSMAHTDLSYLPEYNRMIHKLSYNGEGSYVDYVLGALAAISFYLVYKLSRLALLKGRGGLTASD